jgi:molybdopterin-binding protein
MESHMQISGRNKLTGKVVEFKTDGLMAQVKVSVDPGTVTAIITKNAADELGLKQGDTVTTLVKATSVMICK